MLHVSKEIIMKETIARFYMNTIGEHHQQHATPGINIVFVSRTFIRDGTFTSDQTYKNSGWEVIYWWVGVQTYELWVRSHLVVVGGSNLYE